MPNNSLRRVFTRRELWPTRKSAAKLLSTIASFSQPNMALSILTLRTVKPRREPTPTQIGRLPWRHPVTATARRVSTIRSASSTENQSVCQHDLQSEILTPIGGVVASELLERGIDSNASKHFTGTHMKGPTTKPARSLICTAKELYNERVHRGFHRRLDCGRHSAVLQWVGTGVK